MKKQKAIIIDDEKHARESLRALLQLYCPEVNVLVDICNVNQGKAAIEALQPDIVFLDIAIGQDNGFDLIEALNPIAFHLIFTTAYSEFALKAFQVNAIDYLLKPIEPSLLMAAVDKTNTMNATSQMQQQLEQLFLSLNSQKINKIAITTMEGILFLELDKISYIMGSGNYSTFHLLDGSKIMASKSLKHFEGNLPENIFFRSHQSYLVNLNHIKSIQSSEGIITLHNDTDIALAKSKKEQLFEIMKKSFGLGG